MLKELANISIAYQAHRKTEKEKEDTLAQTKEMYRGLKKDNDDLNRKLNDLQDRVAKSVDHQEYRHAKFNEL